MQDFEDWHVGSPEVQLIANGILIEIVNFFPCEEDISHRMPHHVLMSCISPRPAIGQVWLGASGTSPRLRDLSNLMFVPATVPFLTRFHTGGGLHRTIVIRFPPEAFDNLIEDEPSRFDPCSMTSYNIGDPHIQYGMQQLAKEAMAPGFASSALVESLVSGLLVRLARHFNKCQRNGVSGCGLAPWQMRRIKERIADESAAGSAPSVAELAKLAGISIGHLRRAFKQSAGCTIGDHIRNLRLEQAQTLLSGTNLPIKEIALKLGFSSPYGFSLAFQRISSETPSAFRQRMRSGCRAAQ